MNGLYAELLPHWLKFCAERRACMQSEMDWLRRELKPETRVEPRDQMRKATTEWIGAVMRYVGSPVEIEWPDDPKWRPYNMPPYVKGPCLINGVLIFNDV